MIIQKLKQIKSYCSKHEDCQNCVYRYGTNCRIQMVVNKLHGGYGTENDPKDWNLDRVEEILDGLSQFLVVHVPVADTSYSNNDYADWITLCS